MNKLRNNLIGTLIIVVLIVAAFNIIPNDRNNFPKINTDPLPGGSGFNEEKYKGKHKEEYLVTFYVTGNRKTGREVNITWIIGDKLATEPWSIGGIKNKTWKKSIPVPEGTKLALEVENVNSPGYTDCRILVNGKERGREYAFDWDSCKVYSTVIP